MCGILGHWGADAVPRQIFDDHLNRIRHRGPDHSAVIEIDGLTLGHNRLAIIDLDPRSNQPMFSACGRVALVFNGEIYNYLELKEQLTGYAFRTTSDTEVLIAAYLTWGQSCVTRLSGMFSFALYDRQRKTVFLARDHVGKKPLYFSQREGFLAFASEIRALAGLPGISDELDPIAVNEYFSTGYIGGRRTVYRAISQLPAGHAASFALPVSGPPSIDRYWRLPVAESMPNLDEEELVEELDALLVHAVQVRLQSDVPVGVFLSGGLDSSVVVALAARSSARPVRTLTVSFPGTSIDESRHAERIAKHFGTNHSIHHVHDDVVATVPLLAADLDQPFADSSFVPTHRVCLEARKDLTVALSGDGGDELFAGYGHYDAFAWENRLREHVPGAVRRLIGSVAALLPERQKTATLKRLVYDDPYVSMTAHSARLFTLAERQLLLRGPILANSTPEDECLRRFLPRLDWLQNICQADCQNYMVDDILVKVDRMSMLNSLEVRSPLLDKRIVEFAFMKVPSTLKRRGSVKKYLLKRVAQRYLPPGFEFERKQGFGVPLGAWFKGALGERLAELLSDAPSGYLDRNQAMWYLDSHRRGLSNFSKKLFAMLIWEEWFAHQRRAARRA